VTNSLGLFLVFFTQSAFQTKPT